MSRAPYRRRFAATVMAAAALVAAGCVPDPGGTPTTTTTTVPDTTTTVPDTTTTTSTTSTTTSTTTTSTTTTTTTTSTTTSTTTTTTAPPVDTYDITIDDGGVLTPSQRAQLNLAVARVEGVVTAGLPDVAVNLSPASCLLAGPAINATVDDLLVQVDLEDLGGDGAGNGTLAAAGPCKSRTVAQGGLPSACGLSYDTSSVAYMEANGILDDVSTHELLHCLGIGTKWGPLVTNQFGADPRYTGAAAVAEWHALGGTGNVPLQPFLGAHWSEDVFGDELMTPVSPPGFAPLSRLTIAALSDLGYSVDLNQADTYTLPAPAVALRATPPASISLAGDVRR